MFSCGCQLDIECLAYFIIRRSKHNLRKVIKTSHMRRQCYQALSQFSQGLVMRLVAMQLKALSTLDTKSVLTGDVVGTKICFFRTWSVLYETWTRKWSEEKIGLDAVLKLNSR